MPRQIELSSVVSVEFMVDLMVDCAHRSIDTALTVALFLVTATVLLHPSKHRKSFDEIGAIVGSRHDDGWRDAIVTVDPLQGGCEGQEGVRPSLPTACKCRRDATQGDIVDPGRRHPQVEAVPGRQAVRCRRHAVDDRNVSTSRVFSANTMSAIRALAVFRHNTVLFG